MNRIRVNSDSWTGLAPERAAPIGMSPQGRLAFQRIMFALGCLSLVLLGYQLAGLDPSSLESWGRLAAPAVTVLMAFGFKRPGLAIGRVRGG